MSRDKILVIFFSSILLIGLGGILLRQPIQGVDREVSFSYQNRNLTLDLENQSLLEGEYTGTFDEGTDTVIIATQGKSVRDFASTCSHELAHAEDFSQSHEDMNEFDYPWNWKPKCLDLLKYRT
jgi:hypothetical protein